MNLDVLDGTEPGAHGVADLALRALELRAGAEPRRFPGVRVACAFFNPSLRTRTSMESAAAALGMHPIVLQPGTDAWGWEFREGVVMDGAAAEHAKEAIGVLSQYVDLLGVRSFARLESAEEDRADAVLSSFVRYSRVPVINLESARYHPLQGLADTATWMHRLGPDLQGQPLTLTWAPHPKALPQAVPNQVLLSAVLQGMDVTIAHPDGFDLDPQVLARAEAMAVGSGGSLRVTNDQRAAVDGAAVVYAKSWSGFAGYGRRDDEARARAGLGDWTLTADKVGEAGVMHCLPVRRNVVIADDVLDGPKSWVQEQAGLRMWTAMALLERLCGGSPWNA